MSAVPRPLIHVRTARWSIFASCQLPHCGSTCVRITERSRAVVVAAVIQAGIHRSAWSPNSVRPAFGERMTPALSRRRLQRRWPSVIGS